MTRELRLEPYKPEQLLKNQVIDINIHTEKPTKYMHERQQWNGTEYVKDFYFTTNPIVIEII